MIEAGFVILAVGVLLWFYSFIPRAAMACGDSRSAAHAQRQCFMIAALAWVALTMGLAWAGVLKRWDLRPPPLMGMFAGILVLGPVLAWSTIGDRLARGLPLAALVGLQSFRFPLEVVMHAAAERGIMPMQMSYSGRNFDIVTGITAVLLAAWLRFGRPPRAIVWAWNVLGLLLLANIVTVAALSTPMFAAFGSTPDRLNPFVAGPPFVLLPAVLVLTAWAGHLIVFRALTGQEPGASAQPSTSMSAGSSM
jgi:hypothetical protein